MASNPIDTQAVTRLVTLITFRWGVGTVHYQRYARHSSNVVLGSDTFTALMAIDVDYKTQHGGTNEDDAPDVTCPSTMYPVSEMLDYQFWPTTVTIEEIDLDNESSRRVMWEGVIDLVEESPDKKKGLIRFNALGPKSALKASLGIQATKHCQWTVGDANCKVDLDSGGFRVNGTILTLSDDTMTCTTAGVTGKPNGFWDKGSINVNGLIVMIRSWVSGTTFKLLRRPHPSIVGQTAVFTAGCDGTPAVCNNRFSNIARIMCLGIEMPDYNPQFQSPT